MWQQVGKWAGGQVRWGVGEREARWLFLVAGRWGCGRSAAEVLMGLEGAGWCVDRCGRRKSGFGTVGGKSVSEQGGGHTGGWGVDGGVGGCTSGWVGDGDTGW